MKIGGVTGWLRAMGQAEQASVPISSHLFVEASAHVLPGTPLAHYLEFLDLAGAVLAEPPLLVNGCVTARGSGARPGMGRGGRGPLPGVGVASAAAPGRWRRTPSDRRASGKSFRPRKDRRSLP